MIGSYNPADVTILLKDISGCLSPMDTEMREAQIQRGTHYSEMLPLEYRPTRDYLLAYDAALSRYAGMTAEAVATAAEWLWEERGTSLVLVSLARAGTSVGVLIRRYLKRKYGADVPHYTISIIRGKGIDKNAMAYLLARHAPEDIRFIDGWTGKGAIRDQLAEAALEYPGVDSGVTVLSDPAYAAARCGTHEDFLIPSACLNAVVSGLMSRTVLRSDLIGPEDFHGTVIYRELAGEDRTEEFLTAIERCFSFGPHDRPAANCPPDSGRIETAEIGAHFGIADHHLIKPGIGEATRVLLRRLPWKLLVHSRNDEEHLGHLYRLAEEKNVPVEVYPLRHYRACGIIQKLGDA